MPKILNDCLPWFIYIRIKTSLDHCRKSIFHKWQKILHNHLLSIVFKAILCYQKLQTTSPWWRQFIPASCSSELKSSMWCKFPGTSDRFCWLVLITQIIREINCCSGIICRFLLVSPGNSNCDKTTYSPSQERGTTPTSADSASY